MNSRGRYIRLPAERLPWRVAGPLIFALSVAAWAVLFALVWQ